jgi:membrane protease YdiL (CAAX protease family)
MTVSPRLALLIAIMRAGVFHKGGRSLPRPGAGRIEGQNKQATAMRTNQFRRFVAPARRRAQLWRLFLGVVVMAAIYLAGVAIVLAAVLLAVGTSAWPGWAVELVTAATPVGTLLLLASFIGMALAPMVAVRLVHRRPARTLFGPAVTVLRDFVVAASIVAALLGALLFAWSFWFDAVPNLAPERWLTLLPLAVAGILVQTLAEELVFRAYLTQQLAARFKSFLAWMVLPSLAFGLVHYSPQSAGENTWLVVVAAGVFGLIATDLTRLTGSIGAAWGFHFANNFAAILIVAVDGTIPGLALFLTPYGADDTTHLPALILGDLALMLVAWLILRRALRR